VCVSRDKYINERRKEGASPKQVVVRVCVWCRRGVAGKIESNPQQQPPNHHHTHTPTHTSLLSIEIGKEEK
jgi:hypothetical protein